MTEFHHWDFADEFTAEEAAALIFGIDPANLNDTERIKLNPIIARMYKSYKLALDFYIDGDAPQLEPINEKLESTTMAMAIDFDVDPKTWQGREALTDFSKQKFTRQNLSLWLKCIKKNSEYSFDPKPNPVIKDEKSSGEKLLKDEKPNASLLKMAISMAIGGYGYDPKSLKSEIPKQIQNDATKNGISITDETILRYLRLARDNYLSSEGEV